MHAGPVIDKIPEKEAFTRERSKKALKTNFMFETSVSHKLVISQWD